MEPYNIYSFITGIFPSTLCLWNACFIFEKCMPKYGCGKGKWGKKIYKKWNENMLSYFIKLPRNIIGCSAAELSFWVLYLSFKNESITPRTVQQKKEQRGTYLLRYFPFLTVLSFIHEQIDLPGKLYYLTFWWSLRKLDNAQGYTHRTLKLRIDVFN